MPPKPQQQQQSKSKTPPKAAPLQRPAKITSDQEKLLQYVAQAVAEEVELIQPHLEMCNWEKDIVIRKFEQSLSADVDRLCSSGKIEKAIAKCNAFAEHGSTSCNPHKQAQALFELSFIAFKYQKDAENSLKYAEQSLTLLKSNQIRPDNLAMAIVANHVGVCLYYLNNIDKAVTNMELALDYVYNTDEGEEATILSNLGNIYYHTRQYKLAKLYFERALAKRLKKNDTGPSVQKIKAMLEVLTF